MIFLIEINDIYLNSFRVPGIFIGHDNEITTTDIGRFGTLFSTGTRNLRNFPDAASGSKIRIDAVQTDIGVWVSLLLKIKNQYN